MPLHDLLLIGHLADDGMTEMSFEMLIHVQDVMRVISLVGMRLRLEPVQLQDLRKDFESYGVDARPFLDSGGSGFSTAGVLLLKVCASVHDLGKPFFRPIYVQKHSLTGEQYELQKLHAHLSRLIVKSWLRNSALRFEEPALVHMVADFAAAHQEKYDGRGYPDGLVGRDNSLVGRMLAVVDAVSAITNPRPYEEALDLPTCLARMEPDSGTHFDPTLLRQIAEILRRDPRQVTRSSVSSDVQTLSGRFCELVGHVDLDEVDLRSGDVARVAELRRVLDVGRSGRTAVLPDDLSAHSRSTSAKT